MKELLSTLVEGQIKLAAGQSRHDELLGALAAGQSRHEELLGKLAGGLARMEGAVAHLASATEAALAHHDERLTRIESSMERLEATVERLVEGQERLGERLDSFRKDILTGFTNGAAVDRMLEDHVRTLDSRVTRLEHPPKPRGSKKR